MAIASYTGYAQATPALWNNIMKIEDNKYIIHLPDAWKKVTVAEGSGIDYKFDLSGAGIPATLNGSPMYGFFSVSRMAGKKEVQATDQVLLDFTSFYDRVTEPGFNYDTTTAAIKTVKSYTHGTIVGVRSATIANTI